MPNGTPDWNEKGLPEAEAFFAPIADILETFAKTHNLYIDKYYHDSADWTLRFKHPEGGVASISVLKADQNSIWIGIGWHLDVYRKSERRTKHNKPIKSSLEKEKLNEHLDRSLKETLSWRKEDLGLGVKNPFSDHAKTPPRKAVDRETNKYPKPRL